MTPRYSSRELLQSQLTSQRLMVTFKDLGRSAGQYDKRDITVKVTNWASVVTHGSTTKQNINISHQQLIECLRRCWHENLRPIYKASADKPFLGKTLA